jgi:hypothetical protein
LDRNGTISTVQAMSNRPACVTGFDHPLDAKESFEASLTLACVPDVSEKHRGVPTSNFF